MATITPGDADRERAAYIERAAQRTAQAGNRQGPERFDHEELALFRKWAEEKKLISDEQLGRAATSGKGQRAALEALWGIRSQYYAAVIEKIQRVQEQTVDE